MSQSVVALASFSGDTRVFACTGVFIGCNEFTTRILTSASLIRNPDDEAKIADDLTVAGFLLALSWQIEACLQDNQHVTGTLQHYDLHYNIAVISIMGSCCTRRVKMYDEVQTEPQGEVVAVGRFYESSKLMAAGGTLIDKPSELDCKELRASSA
ncbi:uncharacterized protein LOC125506685, partial [Triticum urartu]|uniref:uncharacterized protein LOC125506685 n=1 Tax=Triticum urartu TaxID=4572 RepID=UPI0020445C6C